MADYAAIDLVYRGFFFCVTLSGKIEKLEEGLQQRNFHIPDGQDVSISSRPALPVECNSGNSLPCWS